MISQSFSSIGDKKIFLKHPNVHEVIYQMRNQSKYATWFLGPKDLTKQ